MASAVARVYNGGLGTEPPAGSRGRKPGQEVRGRSPLETEALVVFRRSIEAANLPTFLKFKYAKQSNICVILAKKSWVAMKLGAWSKTGGVVPSRPRPKTATAHFSLRPTRGTPQQTSFFQKCCTCYLYLYLRVRYLSTCDKYFIFIF